MMGRIMKIVIAVGILLTGLAWRGEQASAINTLMTKNLVVISNTNLLDDYKNPDSVVGSIAGVQNVEVACGSSEQLCAAYVTGKSYILVKTWLGNKWIEDDSRIIYGNYEEKDQDITVLDEVKLYAQPVGLASYNQVDQPKETGQTLQPQKLHTTGSIRYTHKWVDNGRGLVLDSGNWYRIPKDNTNDEWLLNPLLLENTQPTDTPILLTKDDILYDTPHLSQENGEKVLSGVVQPDVYFLIPGIGGGVLWYRIPQNDGTMKWVRKENGSSQFRQFSPSNETVKLRTATRYFDNRGVYDPTLQDWLQPGSYPIDQVDMDWVHLQTPVGWKWVNLSRAPLERPNGITETQESVKLTPATKTYYFPLTGEVCQNTGTFQEQEALSFEKWVSPQGVSWYHISTYSGIVWVSDSK